VLSVSRGGQGSTAQVAINLPLHLRIEKSGFQYTFRYKSDSGDPLVDAAQPWTTLETRTVEDTEVSYVGIEVRAFNGLNDNTVVDVDQFRLERYGPAEPTPYTETFVDSFNGNNVDAGWEWYLPVGGPTYSLTAVPGSLRMSLPAGVFEHWIYTDDAPQLQRTDLGGGDWAIEGELTQISGGAGAGYFTGLEVGFDEYDQIWFGMGQDGNLSTTRIGVDSPDIRPESIPIFQRLEKHWDDYTFKYRHNPGDAWTVMAPKNYPVCWSILDHTTTENAGSVCFMPDCIALLDMLQIVLNSDFCHF
jgi:hypothetical protein